MISKHALSSYFFCKRPLISWSHNPLNWKRVQVTESYHNARSLKWRHCWFCLINKRRGAEFFRKNTKVLDHNTAICFSLFYNFIWSIRSLRVVLLSCLVQWFVLLFHDIPKEGALFGSNENNWCRQTITEYTGWHKKAGTLIKPNKNWRNPRKKIYWQKLNHYNLPFKRQ